MGWGWTQLRCSGTWSSLGPTTGGAGAMPCASTDRELCHWHCHISIPPSIPPAARLALTKADLPSLLPSQPFAPPGTGREWGQPSLPQMALVPSAATGALQSLAPSDSVWWGQEQPAWDSEGSWGKGQSQQPLATRLPVCCWPWPWRCSQPCPGWRDPGSLGRLRAVAHVRAEGRGAKLPTTGCP